MRSNKKCFLAGTKRLLPLAYGLALFVAVMSAQKKNLVVDLGGGVKMEFVLIPAGSFLMGSEAGDADEKPVHKVTITKPFYIGKGEVTQEQWKAVMGGDPSRFKGPKNPVEQVNWFECQVFLAKLESRVKGLRPGLPTEAQWEYACRSGSSAAYSFGDSRAELWRFAWYSADSNNSTHPLGEKEPNARGLLDMYGNVWEWCADLYGEKYYSASPEQDPRGPSAGSDNRVLRGGSWRSDAGDCRSAHRLRIPPTNRSELMGLRVVLDLL